MKIFLRVMGDRLVGRVATELAARDSAFPRQLGPDTLLHWQIERLTEPFCAAYLDNTPARISVVLVEVESAATVEALWALGGREYASICSRNANDCPPAPVILVFDREYPTSELVEMPLLVTDWISGVAAMHDLARRVVASLRRQRHLQERLGGGLLTLNCETRRLVFNDTDSILLSVSELPLAELFLTHMGSVLPLEEICLLFRLAGRSTSGSNIRVTIFQLRFKIELLTRNYFSVVCAYGEGYALRAIRSKEHRPTRPQLEARQSVTAAYQV